MIRPLNDHILVEPVREEKKKGGIILPDTVEKERSERGKVVAVGPGKRDKDGSSTGSGQARRIPLDVKKGDVVLFTKYSPNEVKVDGKEYLVIKEDDVLAIIK
ncbi:MAG: co-chaperone GroES [Candidatus Yanofskybacteria bacterium]|nr:co-chaperone GroES [Candidatus Yanofskybacteria bacterium]